MVLMMSVKQIDLNLNSNWNRSLAIVETQQGVVGKVGDEGLPQCKNL